MVMYRPPCSTSAGTRSIRREIERRRSKTKPLAPTRSVAKKPSASAPPPPRQGSCDAVRDLRSHRSVPPSTTSNSQASTVTDASSQAPPRASSRRIVASPPPPPPPPRRFDPSSAGTASRENLGASALLRPGTAVGVRTRTTKLKTGQDLVLWLKATVVSSTPGGYYEVVYDGSRPSGSGGPKGTVRVARHHVRVINTSPSKPTTTPASLPQPTSTVAANAAQKVKKETLPAARPTTAGKSVRHILSLLPEKERNARAPYFGITF